MKRHRQKLTRKQRQKKRARNERRGRDPELLSWQRAHVVPQKKQPAHKLEKTKLMSRASRAAQEFLQRARQD